MATTTVSKINIKLSAQTAELESGFANGEKFAGQFADAIYDTAERVVASAAEMSLALGKQLFSGVNQQVEQIDQLAGAADRMGAGIAGLSRLAFAADMADSSQETLIAGMEKMVENLGKSAASAQFAQSRLAGAAKTTEEFAAAMSDSVDGTDRASRAFAALGLEVQELMLLSADEAFIKISDAISKLPTHADRSAAAVAIFGGSARELLNVMEQGEAGMRAFGEESDRLGKTIGEDLADKAGAADDAANRLNAALDGLWNTITDQLAPAITGVNELLTDSIQHLQEWDENTLKVVTGVALFVGGAIYAINAIGALVKSVQAITAALTAMNVAQIIATSLKGPAGWALLAGASLAAGAAIGATVGVMVNYGYATQTALDEANESAKQLGDSVAASTQQVTHGVDAAAIAAKAAAREMELLKRQGEQLEQSLRTPFETATDDIAQFQKLLQAGVISWEAYSRAVAKTVDELLDASKAKRELDAPSVRSVAAVTRNTLAGFSAVNESISAMRDIANDLEARRAADAARNRLLAEILAATKANRITVRKSSLP